MTTLTLPPGNDDWKAGTGTVIEEAHAAMLVARSAFTRHLDSAGAT